jgi:formylglycine-generating enzyme required for sulfatase activity
MPSLSPSRAELRLRLHSAREQTDSLFGLLIPGAFYERPIPERHRLIFYLGHLEAFDWNLLWRRTLDNPSFHPAFDKLFEFGIDPAPGQLPSDTPADWPSVEEVREYNRRLRGSLDGALDHIPEEMLHVALEHRLMHAETLAYLLHQLPPECKIAPREEPEPNSDAPANFPIEIPEGVATLGRPRGNGFGWDNEFEEHQLRAPAFRISKYKVTNRDYLEFVRQGGDAPPFLIQNGQGWRLRTMFGEISLPLNWPVYVTQLQASTYAGWRGAALPTEAQFHRAAYGSPSGGERSYPWGEEAPDSLRGNFDFLRWNPVSVAASPAGDSAFGVSQLYGNGWEWTSSVFAPFPGFRAAPYYPNYSEPFFDGEHYVLKGASPRTAACFLRRSFRNWFRPAYPYIYATFRCAENG